MKKHLAAAVCATVLATALLQPATAGAALSGAGARPYESTFAADRTGASGSVSASAPRREKGTPPAAPGGIQASSFAAPLKSLSNKGYLSEGDLGVYGVWLFPDQVLTLRVTSAADYDLGLVDEGDAIVAYADNTITGAEAIRFTYHDNGAGAQYFLIVVGAWESGSFTLDVSMTDAPTNPALTRLSATDRYGTSVGVSQDAFPDGADTVVVATGANFADALAAAGLCGVFDAPLLLVPTGSLPANVSSEIDRLGATKAIVVGGTGAVSTAVQTALAAKPALSGNVTRISGTNRYETAQHVAEAMKAELGSDLPDALIVNGANFADALSVSPLAYADNRPILLTPATYAHPATLAALDSVGVQNVVIAGGTGVVNAVAEQQIETAIGAQADRWAGINRFDTARVVAQNSIASGALSRQYIGLAHGYGFADGLSGGVAAGRAGGVLLLTESHVTPKETEEFLAASTGQATSSRIFGGSGVVWGNVLGMVDSYLF